MVYILSRNTISNRKHRHIRSVRTREKGTQTKIPWSLHGNNTSVNPSAYSIQYIFAGKAENRERKSGNPPTTIYNNYKTQWLIIHNDELNFKPNQSFLTVSVTVISCSFFLSPLFTFVFHYFLVVREKRIFQRWYFSFEQLPIFVHLPTLR